MSTVHKDIEIEFKLLLASVENLIFAGELNRKMVNMSLIYLYTQHINKMVKEFIDA